MKRFALFFTLPFLLNATDDQFKRIRAEFDAREASSNSIEAHAKWLQTAAGQQDLKYITEQFDGLSDLGQYEIPMELARTGKAAVVPLLRKALAKSNLSLAGVFFACHLQKMEPEFAKGVAPLVVPWIGKGRDASSDNAIEVLPILDRELAAKTFFVDSFLSPSASQIHLVLSSCNSVGLKVPKPMLDAMLEAWEPYAFKEDAEYRLQRGIKEAVKALSLHDESAALAKAEQVIIKRPDWAEDIADIHLIASGLSGLYEKLADYASDSERFMQLPLPAQHYFAISYFHADCDNGGIDQALGNSTGDYLPLVRSGYEAIGAKQSIEWLNWMCQPFRPSGPSTNREKRNEQMETMNPSYFEQAERLSEKWEQNHPYNRSEVSVHWKLAAYVSKYADEIRKALGP